MARDALVISKKYHPLSIRRDVREPVIEIVVRDLLLLASIRMHAPDLHVPGAFGIEVNEFTVRRIFRAVVQSLSGSQSRLISASHRNRIDIEVAVPLPHKR